MATRKNTLAPARDGIAATGRNAPAGAKAGPAGQVGTRKSVVTNAAGTKRSVKQAVVDAPVGKPDRIVNVKAKPAAAKKAPAKKIAAKPATKASKAAVAAVPLEKKKAVKKAPVNLKYKGIVIPVGRVPGDDLEIPTVMVKSVADTVKLFAKLPTGTTWRAGSYDDKSSLNIYNRSGAHVAEVRIELK